MLRLLLLGFLIFGFSTGLKDGWLVIKWSQLLHQVGFESVDPQKPMNWSEFILDRLPNEQDN
tara:strand:+ start:973 stop:1158 length:186 start_codon:yes stop_codon:yes gene_type:complete